MDLFERLLAAGDADRNKLVVRLTADRSCWVALSSHLAAQLLSLQQPLPLALELRLNSPSGRGGAGPWHVAWAGAAASTKGTIEIPAALCRCLSIQDGATVTVTALPEVPNAEAVFVEPASEDDWELVEIHASDLEEQLLNQVGVVSVGQPFPFWAGRQTPLFLRVATAEPADLVRLTRGLELAVAPRPRKRPQYNDVGRSGGVEEDTASPKTGQVAWLRVQDCEEGNMLFERRAMSLSASTSGRHSDWQAWQTVTAYIAPETAASAGLAQGDTVAISAISSQRGKKAVARLAFSDQLSPVHVLVSHPVLKSLQLRAHQRVAVWTVKPSPRRQPEALVLHPVEGSSLAALQKLQELGAVQFQELAAAWLASQGLSSKQASTNQAASVPVHDGSLVVVEHAVHGTVHLFVEQRLRIGDLKSGLPSLVSPDQVAGGQVRVELGETVQLAGWQEESSQSATAGAASGAQDGGISFGADWVQAHLLPCLEAALPLLHHHCRQHWWRMGVPTPSGLLICGPARSGKSGLPALLGRLLAGHPECRAHVIHISCREIETDTLAHARDQLTPMLQEAVDRLPTLLILDDLHLLCPAESESPEAAPNAGAAALTQWLCEVFDHFREQPRGRPPLPVVVCGTCSSATELAQPLRAPGRLSRTLTLAAPGTSERFSLLQSSLQSRGIAFSAEQLQALAARADGFDAADVQALMERAVHAAVQRQMSHPAMRDQGTQLEVEQADLDAAWHGFSPASSWGVGQMQGSSSVSGWDDVGGLHDVRDALREALELPTRFAKLLAKAPLRLRTGVLLYGPPGCGKTHVIAAAVAAAGVRFLSVKGPELLNKYIGASEAAVRDVFRRASAAAPCVLFFDEFDAIAPQRGHDSTGVTDRVVNQLLTELDGVEGLKGVVVLAASSRPDLLDAALLRPGRLDRLIFCGLPSPEDRLAILRALSRKMRLASDVDLPFLAGRTQDFTGADLGALLADAQLAAVHAILDAPGGATGPVETQISMRHLEAALKKARPSISVQERLRLEAIYSKFKSSRDPGIGNVDTKGKGKRATLA